ncbi:MAG TPA: metallophosphoesterase, partial [Solirubrobacteraceae bacterium]|nr:metallophosphoesterase [Solirubrobacteraceae bacterium]
MRIAIVSDIHGNRHAFEAVLDDIEASDCEEMWCLGDLVGYGAEPDACVELARRHAAICLAGNHDLGVCGALPLEQFSKGAALAAQWTQDTITPETRDYLCALEPQKLDEQVGLYHASPRDPVWEYVLSSLQADLCLDAQRHRVCLIGHSHVALSFTRETGLPASGQTRAADDEFDLGP